MCTQTVSFQMYIFSNTWSKKVQTNTALALVYIRLTHRLRNKKNQSVVCVQFAISYIVKFSLFLTVVVCDIFCSGRDMAPLPFKK